MINRKKWLFLVCSAAIVFVVAFSLIRHINIMQGNVFACRNQLREIGLMIAVYCHKFGDHSLEQLTTYNDMEQALISTGIYSYRDIMHLRCNGRYPFLYLYNISSNKGLPRQERPLLSDPVESEHSSYGINVIYSDFHRVETKEKAWLINLLD